MRHGPPGMTDERWHLYLLEQRIAAGEASHDDLSAAQVEALRIEAEQANAHFTIDELRQMYGGI